MATLDISKVPALTPPEGVIPNLVDPETLAPVTRIVICIGLSLMLFFLFFRVYSLFRVRGNLRADDYFCFASAASVTAYTGIILDLLGDPLGPHQWNVPITSITLKFVTNSVVLSCMYAVNAILVKCTLLIFYLQIFRPNKRARMMIWTGIFFIVAFYLACIIANMVNCIPVEQLLPGLDPAEWLERSQQDHCSEPELQLTVVQGFFSAITDFYVLTIPISSVLELQLRPSRKLGVLAIFLTGLLACACSIASAYYRWIFWKSADFTWGSMPVYALGSCEMDVGIICSCLPVIFSTVKGMTQGQGLWATLVKYIRSGGRHSGASGSEGPFPRKEPASGSSGDNQGLPEVPSGTLTGMRSFIRKAYRSKPAQSINVTTELHAFTELASIDENYHSQLQRGYFESSQTHLSNPSQASITAGTKVVGTKG